MKLKVLDLFSGLGGFSLGLERTGGFETVAFCEIDPFCRHVLAKHWPGVLIHDDIQTLSADWLAEMGAWPDVICGGFPCQDLSYAGKGAGLAGERSGLWREYARLIGEIRPAFVVVENVAALLGRGLGDVLGDLAALGYDAEWHGIPASAIGAPHRRDRVWIVAYPSTQRWRETRALIPEPQKWATGCGPNVADAQPSGRGGRREDGAGPNPAMSRGSGRGSVVANPDPGRWRIEGHERGKDGGAGPGQLGVRSQAVANTNDEGRHGGAREIRPDGGRGHASDGGKILADAGGSGLPGAEQAGWRQSLISAADIRRAASQCSWGRFEPGMGGTDDGLSARVHRYPVVVEPWEGDTPRTVGRGYPDRRQRLMALGNSVVPQIPELIGRAILETRR